MNKNGWGLRFELFFIFIFLFCLLFATIGLNKLGLLGNSGEYDIYGNLVDESTYKKYEEIIRKSALEYYNDKYNELNNDTIFININTLQSNGYLSSIKDENNKICSGYAKVTTNKNVVAYIKCSKYVTDGYNSNYE